MKILRVTVLGAVLGVALLATACGKKSSDGDNSAGGSAASATVTASAPAATTAVPTATVVAPPKSATADVDAAAVRGCCAALRSASGSAKAADKPKYDAAASACEGIAVAVKNGSTTRASAVGAIRASFHGQALPAACN